MPYRGHTSAGLRVFLAGFVTFTGPAAGSVIFSHLPSHAEHKAGVQAVSDGEFADKGTPTCRRNAAHTGVSAGTHGLSERQTSREIDLHDVHG